jgi:hypothetical protein
VEPLEPKDNNYPYRLIAFDLETTQHQPVEGSNGKKMMHFPNFISIHVACPECIASGAWKENMDGKCCQVCGKARRAVFCQRPFIKTKVDYMHISENPMEEFIEWLVYQLPRRYDSMVYSHFGGRFGFLFY